jgi:hypothetical protein
VKAVISIPKTIALKTMEVTKVFVEAVFADCTSDLVESGVSDFQEEEGLEDEHEEEGEEEKEEVKERMRVTTKGAIKQWLSTELKNEGVLVLNLKMTL